VPNTYWAWVALREAPGLDTVTGLIATLPSTSVQLAVGDPHAGPDGFRRTHQQARDAQRVGLTTTKRITHYRDVALITLIAGDELGARAFLTAELQGLAAQDRRTERLRTTLGSYLSHGMNAAATAHALGIHEQTVTNRLRAIEQRTGRSVAERHAELAIALQLAQVLDDNRT
jgi:sugar diacid utilization regulator